MEYEDYIRQGPSGEVPLKLMLCGSIQNTESEKIGIVSVVHTTDDKDLAEQKVNELAAANPDNCYVVYSAPLNANSTELSHCPSTVISKGGLQ